jgi:Ni/Fe-hydrogenase subunit HybB-like protein
MTLPKLTFWRIVFLAIAVAGLAGIWVRVTRGLGASTNLTNDFPWGLWIGFDMLCGVGLAAGGFAITACVYLFNLERFRPIVRPTVLTAFLGYTLAIVGLLFDLGRPFVIWHPMVMGNPNSVMFEVALCVMLYTTVLALEFSPVVLERFQLFRAAKRVKAIAVPLVLLGVILSTLHQSSLGSLFLIVPHRLHPLWYTPLLPVFFYISAIAAGLAMVIFESFLSYRAFRKQIEVHLLREIARVLVVVLAVYLVLRFEDLSVRGVNSLLWQPRAETLFFWMEVMLGGFLPLGLLAFRQVRASSGGLFLSAVMVVLGFVTNRLNVSFTGLQASAATPYFPKWPEISITLLLVATGFALFALAVRYLPIYTPVHENGRVANGVGKEIDAVAA